MNRLIPFVFVVVLIPLSVFAQEKTPGQKSDAAKSEVKSPDVKTNALAKNKNVREPNPEAGCAACGACGSGCAAMAGGSVFLVGSAIAFVVCLVVLNIALLVFVARDAKNRKMDSSVIWMLLVMVTGPVGFLIFMLSRPQGSLVVCGDCGGSRLQASKTCPHCENS